MRLELESKHARRFSLKDIYMDGHFQFNEIRKLSLCYLSLC